MNACGNIRIATLFARPLALVTSNSEIHGNDRTSCTRPFAMLALGPLGGARTENGLTRDGFLVNHISVSIGFEAIAASCTVERIESGARASATRRGAFPRTRVSRKRRISGSSYESHDSEAARVEVSSSRTGGTSGATRSFGDAPGPTNAPGGGSANKVRRRRTPPPPDQAAAPP